VHRRIAAAGASLICQSALVSNPAAARAALAKHHASIAPEQAGALQEVGSYTIDESKQHTSLHEAVKFGDAATLRAIIVASAKLIDVESHGACREILEHHAAAHASITEDPTTLVASALAHCATLSATEEPFPATAISLRAYHFDPHFLWVTPAARIAVVNWAQYVFITQLEPTTPLFKSFKTLPDDCAGDVLEFFEPGMTHERAVHIAKHCSSPEARAWVRAVITAAVVAKATAELVPAAEEGDLATVQDCLFKKADIEFELNGRTALIGASDYGHSETVQFLVEAEADKEAKDNGDRTALIWASHNGHTASVQVMLKAGADKEAKDRYGKTALWYASWEGHSAIVQVLMEARADKEAKDSLNGYTALIAASLGDHTDVVQLLVKAEADKEAKTKNGRTVLIWASWNGSSASVQFLVEAEADKEAKDNDGRTVLMWASYNGHSASVQVLLKAGADKEAKDKDGNTALILASYRGHTDTVQVLVNAQADKEAKNKYGYPALIRASLGDHTEVVQVLVDAKADKEAKHKFGNTALIAASENGHTASAHFLVEAGADRETTNNDGSTALMKAADGGHTAVCTSSWKRGLTLRPRTRKARQRSFGPRATATPQWYSSFWHQGLGRRPWTIMAKRP